MIEFLQPYLYCSPNKRGCKERARDKMTEINTGLTINDHQIRDLMIYYASQGRDFEFGYLYLVLYPGTTTDERLRCAYFIRLAMGLEPDNRNIY